MKVIALPADSNAAALVEKQLRDFIRRGVADALSGARQAFDTLTPDKVLGFVEGVYESAFTILQSLGDSEASR